MWRYLSLFVLLQLTVASAAGTEIRFSARQAEIIPIVGSYYIDQAIHKEFWDEFPDDFTRDPAKVAEFEAEMPKFLLAMNEYNKSLMEAAEISLRNSEPTRTERLRRAEENVVRLEPGDLTGPTDAFLKTVADGSPFEFSDGAKVITSDHIEQMIFRFESAFERSQLLYVQEWSPIPKARELKRIQASLETGLPFNYTISDILDDDDRAIKSHTYSIEDSEKMVTITAFQNPYNDGGLFKLYYMALSSIYHAKTMDFTFPKETEFRELKSVEFQHTTDVGSTKILVSTRMIYRPSDRNFITVQVLSENNADVVRARYDLESSLELGQ